MLLFNEMYMSFGNSIEMRIEKKISEKKWHFIQPTIVKMSHTRATQEPQKERRDAMCEEREM